MKLWHTIVNKSLLGIRTLLTKSRSHYQLTVDDTTENTLVKVRKLCPIILQNNVAKILKVLKI